MEAHRGLAVLKGMDFEFCTCSSTGCVMILDREIQTVELGLDREDSFSACMSDFMFFSHRFPVYYLVLIFFGADLGFLCLISCKLTRVMLH